MDRQELEAKIKEMQDSDPLFSEKQKIVRHVLERVIYLQPHISKVIVGLETNAKWALDQDQLQLAI